MTTVLITGSEGFIGSHLNLWDFSKYRVRLYDLKFGADIFGESLENAVKASDVVIHLAALVSVNDSFKRPKDYFRTNVLGTARVLELCLKHNKKLIYPSSAAVYFRHLSPYAESKALGEDLCVKAMDYGRITVLRFFNVYGPEMNPESGSVMYQFLKGTKEGSLTIFGDGTQTRDFIHIDDLAKIIKAAISKKWDGKIVDCGNGKAYSMNYLASLFKRFSGKKDLQILHLDARREIKWSKAKTKELKSLYKKPLKQLKQGVKELFDL